MKRTRRGAPPLLVLGCLLVAAGCGGQDETRPAQWPYISAAIIQPNCATANCHSPLSERSGVRLDGIQRGYDQLLSRHFVVPNNPAGSALVALLKAQGSRRMPPDVALPNADIALIEQWIVNGATATGPGGGAPSVDAGAGN